jgi:hypothetical protein
VSTTHAKETGVVSDVSVDTVPKPIEVGPEMEALRRFCRDSTWEGWIREGGMGPGTPTMKGVGRATFKPIQDGRWIVGDFEQDQFLDDGTFVLKWELHWVVGWAPRFGEYRAAMADAYGASPARTDLRFFAGRTHWLIAQDGWEEVAQACIDWIGSLHPMEPHAMTSPKES